MNIKNSFYGLIILIFPNLHGMDEDTPLQQFMKKSGPELFQLYYETYSDVIPKDLYDLYKELKEIASKNKADISFLKIEWDIINKRTDKKTTYCVATTWLFLAFLYHDYASVLKFLSEKEAIKKNSYFINMSTTITYIKDDIVECKSITPLALLLRYPILESKNIEKLITLLLPISTEFNFREDKIESNPIKNSTIKSKAEQTIFLRAFTEQPLDSFLYLLEHFTFNPEETSIFSVTQNNIHTTIYIQNKLIMSLSSLLACLDSPIVADNIPVDKSGYVINKKYFKTGCNDSVQVVREYSLYDIKHMVKTKLAVKGQKLDRDPFYASMIKPVIGMFTIEFLSSPESFETYYQLYLSSKNKKC